MQDGNLVTVDSRMTTLNVKPESVVSQNVWPKDEGKGNCWWKASIVLGEIPTKRKYTPGE